MAYSSSTGSPCGACKFLRRKCASNCVFAPYFSNENGAARFSAIHKVFGASNASKLLLNVPQSDRSEAVLTIAYEAQARLSDPVYGCAAHIFSLQHQVAILQAQLMQTKMQIAGMASSTSSVENQCQVENNEYMYMNSYMQNFSTDYCMGYNTELVQSKSDIYAGDWSRTMELMHVDDVTDFDSLASKIMTD